MSLPKEIESTRVSTRHTNADEEIKPLEAPRLGRRESEPHSTEVSYIYEVLQTNFSPPHHVLWDLHHYFQLEDGTELDVQFDISFFLNFKIPFRLSSYKASQFNGRKPDVAINILSRSTWRKDLVDIVDICRLLKIPVYIVFAPYHVATKIYEPPFLRVYLLQDDETHKIIEIRHICVKENGTIDFQHVAKLPETIPFWVGLKKLPEKGEKNQDLYRLIFIDPQTKQILETRFERFKAAAEAREAQLKADFEKFKAAAEAREAQLKADIEHLKQELEKYRRLLKKHGILDD